MIDKELKKADENKKKIEKELEALILKRKEKQKKLRKAIASEKNLLEKKLIKDIKALGYKIDTDNNVKNVLGILYFYNWVNENNPQMYMLMNRVIMEFKRKTKQQQ